MNNETSIKYISSLLNNPGSLTDGDQGSIALFRQTFPYFLPARYMMALELHRKVAFAPEMLSGILPYMGDWMQFCDFLEAGLNEQVKYMPAAVPAAPVTSAEIITSRVVDKKKVTAHPEPVVLAVQEETPVVAAVAETVPELPEVTDTIAPPVAEPVKEPVAVQHEEPATPMAEAILPTDEPEEDAFVPPVAVHEMPAPIATAPKEEDYVVPPVAYEPPAKEQVAPVAEHEASFADIIAESIAADAHKAHESHVPPAPPKEEVITPVAVAEPEVEIPAVLHSQPAPVVQVAPLVPEVAIAAEAEETVSEAIEPVYTFRQSPPVYAEPIISHASEVENTEDIIIPPVYETTHTSSPEIYIADIKETLAVAPAPEPVAEPPAEVAAPAQYETVFAPSDDPLIFPIYTGDYFLQQGEKIPEEIPQVDELKIEAIEDEDKSLMVVMSFSEWLLHFKSSSEKQKEETKDQKALRSMWQKEKLAAAIEEENEEIPENVFEMAVNSISKEDGLLSETLAEIYIKQGKYDKAVEMYRKLSLRNPQKSIYFARKIDEALKDKES